MSINRVDAGMTAPIVVMGVSGSARSATAVHPGPRHPQPIFMCQQTFSAALIAHLELLKTGDARRNRICWCTAVPHPQLKEDLPGQLVTTAQNMINCNRAIPLWLRRSRLYPGASPLRRRATLRAPPKSC